MQKATLAKVYREICQGFSEGIFLKKTFFFKHFDSLDFSLRDEFYEEEFKISLSRGLPLSKDREKQIVELGIWGEEQEKKLEVINKNIESVEISLRRVKESFQKNEIEKMIKNYYLERDKIFLEKKQLIGFTVEDEASKRADERLIINNIYKNKDFVDKYFDNDDYEYLTKYERIIFEAEFWGNVFSKFTQENIKKIAFKNYFLRPFSISKQDFFKKDGISLTNWQLDLINYGEYAQHIISKCRGKNIPEELFDTPDKIEEWLLDEENNKQKEQGVDKLKRNIDKVFKTA